MYLLNNNKGFSMLELSLVLGLLAIMTLYISKFILSVKEDANQVNERYNAFVIERGIKTVFNDIIDTFETICSPPSDTSTTFAWGWRANNCRGTSPLPVFLSRHYIRYNINFGSLPNPAALQNRIAKAFAPYCQVNTATNNYIDLFCPNLSRLQYDIGGTLVNVYHNLGTSLNPDNAPTVEVDIDRFSEISKSYIGTKTYRFSLVDIFEERKKYSIQKMSELAEAIRTAGQNFTAREVANSAPTGLNSIDDVVVPYFWRVFGDNYAGDMDTVCNSTCSNYTSPDIWRVGTNIRPAVLMRRAINNLMSGDRRYYTDGFNNPVAVFPFMSQCVWGNLSGCSINAPTRPQPNYWNVSNVKPPFTSALYNEFGNNKNVAVPLHDRYFFTH